MTNRRGDTTTDIGEARFAHVLQADAVVNHGLEHLGLLTQKFGPHDEEREVSVQNTSQYDHTSLQSGRAKYANILATDVAHVDVDAVHDGFVEQDRLVHDELRIYESALHEANTESVTRLQDP